jgi:predicted nuclease with RNAse H fold
MRCRNPPQKRTKPLDRKAKGGCAKLADALLRPTKQVVVGIDVGGPRKGFHAVALADGNYLDRKQTPSVRELVRWVREEIGAQVVAIDSPCRWRSGKSARAAELELLEDGIRCFLTPTRNEAARNTTGFYQWMLRGAELFRALGKTHPLCHAGKTAGGKCTFETFPHAITWHLRGGKADAIRKRPQRLALLRRHGVSVAALTNMDWIDAALCALTAEMFAAGRSMHFYGDRRTGHIVVPRQRAESGLRGE